ncbi:MAG TPA: hypothetical protein ENN85_08925 [Methanoculleus sp.]|nr:hypothetical protein [Methanoculleus sp.]
MTIETLFEIEGLRCIEPSFAELTEDLYTAMVLAEEADEARLLVDKGERPIAFAIRRDDAWGVTSFVFRACYMEVIEAFEKAGGDIYQEPREVWIRALREYYARELQRDVAPAPEDMRPDRPDLVEALLREVWGTRPGWTCLDCCCGSGAGSLVLRRLGMTPLAYDNDAELLARGLASGRLLPDETMWIDGTRAGDYLDGPVEAGVALMLGDISSFNAPMWEDIACELLDLSGETLITVATEPEVRTVAAWCEEAGRDAETWENDRDPIYDHWVCLSRQ